MTVIAYKDGVLAADSQLTAYNAINRAQKIVRLPDGGVAGGCGQWSSAYQGLKWLEDGREGEPPAMKEATIMLVKADGSVWLAEDGFPEFPLLDRIAAVGCGADAAMMAMRMGAGAVEAVQRVIGQDALCGEHVQSLALVPLATFPPIKTHTKRKPKATKRRRV